MRSKSRREACISSATCCGISSDRRSGYHQAAGGCTLKRDEIQPRISGVLDIIKQNWTGGAVSLIIGIAILVLGWVAAQIVLLVLGILIAVKGVVALLNAFKKKGANALEIVFPILTVVIGVMLAFGNGLDIMILIAGCLLAIDGVLGLIGSLKK